MRITQQFAERKVERACTRDLTTKEGAEHLARCLVYYWEARGVKIEADVVPCPGTRGFGGGETLVYAVRTKGIPLNRTVSEPAGLQGRAWV